jgi:hypothetical protein
MPTKKGREPSTKPKTCPQCGKRLVKRPDVLVRDGAEDLKSGHGAWLCEDCGYARIYGPTLEKMLLARAKARAVQRVQIPARVRESVVALLKAQASENNGSMNDLVADYVQRALGQDEVTRVTGRKKTPRCPKCPGKPALHRVPVAIRDMSDEFRSAKPLWACGSCTYARVYGRSLAMMGLERARRLDDNKTQITFRFSGSTGAKLKAKAEERHRSINSLLVEYVERGLETDIGERLGLRERARRAQVALARQRGEAPPETQGEPSDLVDAND